MGGKPCESTSRRRPTRETPNPPPSPRQARTASLNQIAPPDPLDLGRAGVPPTIADVVALARSDIQASLSEDGLARIEAGHRALMAATEGGAPIYGLTTGLGAAVDTALQASEARQRRIPLARAVGVGPPAPREDVRAMIAARLMGLCAGRSDAAALLGAQLAAAALSFEAYRGNLSPLDPRATEARPAPGQALAASRIMALLADGALPRPGGPRRLQDPLSFRCVASVAGAALAALEAARTSVEIELGAGADNPAVFAADGSVLSNGNFDTTHLALALEGLGLSLARVAALSVERIMQLMSPGSSGLPRFLAVGEGRNGLATLQKTASALMAEIQHLANPMPVVLSPVADRVEDYGTMAPAIVRKTRGIVAHMRLLTAVEMLVSAHAVDLRGETELGCGTGPLHAAIRALVPPLDDDRPSAPDIAALEEAIAGGLIDRDGFTAGTPAV